MRFLSAIEAYIRACEVEQAMQLEGRIPGYAEYIDLRLDTTAVKALCALAE